MLDGQRRQLLIDGFRHVRSAVVGAFVAIVLVSISGLTPLVFEAVERQQWTPQTKRDVIIVFVFSVPMTGATIAFAEQRSPALRSIVRWPRGSNPQPRPHPLFDEELDPDDD